MLPPPPSSQSELAELVSRRQVERQAEAAAERLRARPGPRRRTASFLHHLADRLAPSEERVDAGAPTLGRAPASR
jgi:hypothetical protein